MLLEEVVHPMPFRHHSTTAKPVILWIENNENYVCVRKAVLRHNGFNVVTASNEEEALKILAQVPVCLAIADQMLRGARGAKLAKQMKAVKPYVPIIIYSERQRETLQNADAFIDKDEPSAVFLKMIHGIVQRF